MSSIFELLEVDLKAPDKTGDQQRPVSRCVRLQSVGAYFNHQTNDCFRWRWLYYGRSVCGAGQG